MVRFLLSIFSFDTVEYTSLRIPRGLIGALLILLSMEGILHLYEDKLPHPVLWGNTETSAKMLQAESWLDKHDNFVDVLILGPSHARFGISPKAVNTATRRLNLTVYNGALNGRTYPVLEFVLKKVYAPALRPRILVLAVNPLVFNRYNVWMERNTLEFFQAPMPRALSAEGIERAWRVFLNSNVNLYRYRERQEGLREGRLDSGAVLDEYGYSSIEGLYDEQARARLQSPEHPYQTIMRDFQFGGPSKDAFVRILQYALNQETPVAVVNMPFRKNLLSISSTGRRDYHVFLKEMSVLQLKYGFLWLDYQASLSLTNDDFRDVDHLNAQGAIKLSAELGKDLAAFIASTDKDLHSGVR
jgi:hypothetical protein